MTHPHFRDLPPLKLTEPDMAERPEVTFDLNQGGGTKLTPLDVAHVATGAVTENPLPKAVFVTQRGSAAASAPDVPRPAAAPAEQSSVVPPVQAAPRHAALPDERQHTAPRQEAAKPADRLTHRQIFDEMVKEAHRPVTKYLKEQGSDGSKENKDPVQKIADLQCKQTLGRFVGLYKDDKSPLREGTGYHELARLLSTDLQSSVIGLREKYMAGKIPVEQQLLPTITRPIKAIETAELATVLNMQVELGIYQLAGQQTPQRLETALHCVELAAKNGLDPKTVSNATLQALESVIWRKASIMMEKGDHTQPHIAEQLAACDKLLDKNSGYRNAWHNL
jgi:hypothetical protein